METSGLLCKGGPLGGDQLGEVWVKMLEHTKCTQAGSSSCLGFLHSACHPFSSLFISSLLISSSTD